MIDFIVGHWNNILTLAGFIIASASGYSQIQHYRAQPADLNVLETMEARYLYRKIDSIMDYKFEVRVENSGREATTISGATLSVDGKTLELDRYEGSTEVPIAGTPSPNLPVEAGDEVRVPGNHVTRLKYRTTGERLDDPSADVKGTLQIRTAGGDVTEHPVTFRREIP
jgi:hypothetical protein